MESQEDHTILFSKLIARTAKDIEVKHKWSLGYGGKSSLTEIVRIYFKKANKKQNPCLGLDKKKS